jgi:CubicO group peptidase (beta-lactamase class C family)
MATLLDEKLLEPLLKRAEETHSDAVLVMHKGELVGVWRFGKPKQIIETMSVTKSIINLAIGRLVTKGLLTSIDESVCTFYPEWKQGRKKNITIKHIMNHMSGLQNEPRTDIEIYPSPDFVQLALCAELTDDPGTHFAYNNKATNLLPGIIEKISGHKLDEFMATEIFTTLGINEFSWRRDSIGNPHGMAGLALFPEDLAKLGQFVLNRGNWGGQQIIDASWFVLTESQFMGSIGLLWWVERDTTNRLETRHIENLRAANVPREILEKLEGIKGEYAKAFGDTLRSTFGEDWPRIRDGLPKGIKWYDVTYGDVKLYQANGDLGQVICIYPKQQCVFVRMISEENYTGEHDSFHDFFDVTKRIVQSL